MKYFFFIVGIGFVLQGATATPHGDGSVMHQIYSALYIVGGFLCMGIGAMIEKLQAVAKEAQAQTIATKGALAELQAIRAASSAEDTAENLRFSVINTHFEAANQWRERADSLLTNIEANTRQR